MRVYRCISAKEIINVYKGKYERQAIFKGKNTHKYEKNKNYIHFFRYSQSAEIFSDSTFMASMDPSESFVLFMTANIPNDLLNKYIGYGIYPSNTIGRDLCMSKRIDVETAGNVPIPEYAMPESDFSKDFIVSINNNIEYELKSSEEEYKKYIVLLDFLYKKLGDYGKVTDYLRKHNLQRLLNVKDDDRTEEQIREERFEDICNIFSNDDLIK